MARIYMLGFMESWLTAVDQGGRYIGTRRNIPGSTPNHQNEGQPHNVVWMLHSVYALLTVCRGQCVLY
jgi:hypothetical protein